MSEKKYFKLTITDIGDLISLLPLGKSFSRKEILEIFSLKMPGLSEGHITTILKDTRISRVGYGLYSRGKIVEQKNTPTPTPTAFSEEDAIIFLKSRGYKIMRLTEI